MYGKANSIMGRYRIFWERVLPLIPQQERDKEKKVQTQSRGWP